MGQPLASPNMKQLLLICAVVALVGCGAAEEKAAKAKAEAREAENIEAAIRKSLNKSTGELTEADLKIDTSLPSVTTAFA